MAAYSLPDPGLRRKCNMRNTGSHNVGGNSRVHGTFYYPRMRSSLKIAGLVVSLLVSVYVLKSLDAAYGYTEYRPSLRVGVRSMTNSRVPPATTIASDRCASHFSQISCTAPRRPKSIFRNRIKDRYTLVPKVEVPGDVVDSVAQTAHHLSHHISQNLHHSSNALKEIGSFVDVASEPVVLPCHRMRCMSAPAGTPDLKAQGIALLSLLFLYLTSTPGVLAGVLDMYLIAPIQRTFDPNFKYSIDDLALGKLIAEGGFGEVYRATLIGKKQTRDVIVKRAKEFGRPEVWMNERMQRSAPGVIAEFITAFNEDDDVSQSPILLVWNNEGEYTLSNLMAKQDFPFNAAKILFDENDTSLQERTIENKAKLIQVLMEQILSALKACHDTGIVHRDVKPQNFILSSRDKRVKLIDLGAAADLRIGINYVPNEFLLDPRYAPPQQYIMSTRTPKAPPAPIAVFLSPVLWQMNYPDRFDIYSAGMSMLQMVFAPLRSDNALIVFNRRLRKEWGYSLETWRKNERSKLYDEGFKILDANNGAGWDLLNRLLAYEPKERPSAAEALSHPFFGLDFTPVAMLNVGLANAGKVMDKIINSDILLDYVGGKARGLDKIFTEVELKEEFQEEMMPPSEASNTIRWWDTRKKALERNKMDATETQLIFKEEVLTELKKKVRKPPRRPV